MPKLPDPPAPHALAAIASDPHILRTGTELWCVYARGGYHPRAWNTFRSYGPVKTMRFDHHEEPVREQDRRILYGASRIPICIAEFFQMGRMIDRDRGEPWLVGFTVVRDVSLLNLCGTWPTRAGASMAINTGRRDRARHWSHAVYEAYPHIEGLWYPSSMYANRPAFAFYERAEESLAPPPFFICRCPRRGYMLPSTALRARSATGSHNPRRHPDSDAPNSPSSATCRPW